MGLLRTTAALRHLRHHDEGGAGAEAAELWVRQARKDSRPVATMQCVEAGGEFVLTCEVYPTDRLTVEPIMRGPYVFATEREAEEFADEAALVLEYLGCEIGSPLAESDEPRSASEALLRVDGGGTARGR